MAQLCRAQALLSGSELGGVAVETSRRKYRKLISKQDMQDDVIYR